MSTTEVHYLQRDIHCLETSTSLLGVNLRIYDVIGASAGRRIASLSDSMPFTVLAVAARVAVTAALILAELALVLAITSDPLITGAILIGMYFYPVPNQPIPPPLPRPAPVSPVPATQAAPAAAPAPLPVPATPPVAAAPVIAVAAPSTPAPPQAPPAAAEPVTPPQTTAAVPRSGATLGSSTYRPARPRDLQRLSASARPSSDTPGAPPNSLSSSVAASPSTVGTPLLARLLDAGEGVAAAPSRPEVFVDHGIERYRGEEAKNFLIVIFTQALGDELGPLFVNRMLPPNIESLEYDPNTQTFTITFASLKAATISEVGPNALEEVRGATLKITNRVVKGRLEGQSLIFEDEAMQLTKYYGLVTIVLKGLCKSDESITLSGTVWPTKKIQLFTGTDEQFTDTFAHTTWN